MDLDYIESLAELLQATRVAEVTIRKGDRQVTLRRRPGTAHKAATVAEAVAPSRLELPRPTPEPRHAEEVTSLVPAKEAALVPVAGGAEAGEPRFEIVRAHRVGLFRRGASADGEPLVRIDDVARAQQQLGSIESMQLFDEVDSTVSGRVVGIFVADGEPVQYGQELFHLRVGGNGAVPEADPPAEAES